MVLTFGEIVRHIELGDVVGDLAVADIVPVQPDVEAGVDSFKKQEGTGGIRVFVPCERVGVGTARIVLRHIGRVEREWEADVGVLVFVVALHLPAEGYYFLPPRAVRHEVREIEFFSQFMNT